MRENPECRETFCPTGVPPSFSAPGPIPPSSTTLRIDGTVSQIHVKQLCDFCVAFTAPNSVQIVWLARALGKDGAANEVKTIINMRFGQSLLI